MIQCCLPLVQNGRVSLGARIHRYINSDQFLPECLLDCLHLSTDHHALEIANRVEATLLLWRRRNTSKNSSHGSTNKSRWEMVKDFVGDGDKWEVLADRAESLLICLRQRFPSLPQTTLDMSKIQYNKVYIYIFIYLSLSLPRLSALLVTNTSDTYD